MNEYVQKALKRNGVVMDDKLRNSGKKKNISISMKLKKANTYQKRKDITQEWAEAWQKDMDETLIKLRRAAMRDDHGEIMHMIDQLKGMSNKRFTGLKNVLQIITDPIINLADEEHNE